MEKIIMNEQNCIELISNAIKNQEECFIYGTTAKTVVLCGDSGLYNIDYINKNNLFAPNIPNVGGVMVLSAGDIELAYFSKNLNCKFNYEIANIIIEYLNKKNINCKLYGNDLIIDEKYKCGSFSSIIINNILYSAFHISVNVDLELIKKICKKPMAKIPKGLSEFGITTEEIKELIKYL